MHADEEMFLSAIPVTPRDPMAAPSTPRIIESWDESQTNDAGVTVGVGVTLGVTVGVGVGFELLPHPVNTKSRIARADTLTKTFKIISHSWCNSGAQLIQSTDVRNSNDRVKYLAYESLAILWQCN